MWNGIPVWLIGLIIIFVVIPIVKLRKCRHWRASKAILSRSARPQGQDQTALNAAQLRQEELDKYKTKPEQQRGEPTKRKTWFGD